MMQFTTEEAYARLISHNMTVPQRIKATGDIVDDENTPNGLMGGWDYANEKFDMKVPERILVAGQDQHIGTKAPPREIQLDNAVLPTDPGMIRVNTPPRVITLDQHYFPSADDFPAEAGTSPPRQARTIRSQGDGARAATPRCDNFNDSINTESRLILRDPTPPMGNGEGLSISEELVHLRRQIVKLNRRVMSIEAEQLQRQQKEKIAYAIGIAYILFKMIAWLNRS
ncbi:Transport and Golgi organization protein 11 [Papilio machaon]|uniref:Transport and Golgi organization protein 11 n=1 Tax=Papilio machaon TaxID=76193 RepID=A0A194R844_PAPMA|nr:transport and Golgi organization protein 11 [Papilio machaon]XP_014360325.1 transport and Golgi organization protein 11 [Papilio machaon]KPJ13674.1 Transport and Golgi organization protein 11 [Papilio machaon]